jgi:hypothetical protein
MNTKSTDTSEASTAAAAGAGSTAAAADAPPSTVSLDVVTAMHRRLLVLQAKQQTQEEEIGDLKTGSERLGAMALHASAQIEELHQTVTQHAELIDGAGRTLDEIGTRLAAQPRRGETERRLPRAAGSTILEHGSTAPAELQIDPKDVGEQLVKLPGGQEVIVRVRRPTESGAPEILARNPVGRGFIRDGQAPGRGKTRRS